jgi:murein L,D-transpeptidase YafK
MKHKRLLLSAAVVFAGTTSFKAAKSNPDDFLIEITKTEHQLKVYEGEACVATYPVVFGNNDMGDKMMEGDRKTPEGTFHISFKKVHNKWDRFMLIDYPTVESYVKFNDRKNQGLIPSNAKIGGAIGIHGTWPHEDYVIDRNSNWTLGCISMKNVDVEELYDNIAPGTLVVIKH